MAETAGEMLSDLLAPHQQAEGHWCDEKCSAEFLAAFRQFLANPPMTNRQRRCDMDEDQYEAQIGKVESTMLGVEDHGILTAVLYFDFGGSGQGISAPIFDSHIKHTRFKGRYDDGSGENSRVGSAYGMEFIRRLMMACGVDRWEKIPGRTVFVLRDKGDSFGYIKGIRPLPTEGGREFIFDDLQVIAEVESA